jgi:hypothetical protein
MEIIVALLGVFPVSFLAFVLSERLSMVHQTRVGRGIQFGAFFAQQLSDWRTDFKTIPSIKVAMVYLLQLSAAALVFLDFNGAFVLYLAINWALLSFVTHDELEVFDRIGADRSQMRFLIGAFISFICVLGAGLTQQSANLSAWALAGLPLVFLLPFVVSGMVLFGEHPFSPFYSRVYWFKSSRFFVWCMLAARLFLGDVGFGLDFFIKSIMIYLGFRMLGQYFPKFSQADLFRISVIYFIPVVFFLFLLSGVLSV